MNIACFGCSFTAGMPDNNWYSWPEMLATIRPTDNIYNLAVGGSSLLFSIYLRDKCSKLINFDKVIFQITNPHRFSTVDNVDLLKLSNQKNYYRLSPKIREEGNIITITPGNSKLQWTTSYDKIKFARQYYNFYNKDIGLLEHSILKNVVKEKSNISFDYYSIPKSARKNVIDDSGHFNKNGHNIISEWINNELERSIH